MMFGFVWSENVQMISKCNVCTCLHMSAHVCTQRMSIAQLHAWWRDHSNAAKLLGLHHLMQFKVSARGALHKHCWVPCCLLEQSNPWCPQNWRMLDLRDLKSCFSVFQNPGCSQTLSDLVRSGILHCTKIGKIKDTNPINLNTSAEETNVVYNTRPGRG